uniref:Uncharacterized protein n=1 Tax=Coccidioides posadasii RMSCC 3488 TaxID=454284 RepID=A0A0J6FQZ3_COCPO|nr:hypothetical protein CPAG_07746 [Coccidioides posadasii RMSCC 3488]
MTPPLSLFLSVCVCVSHAPTSPPPAVIFIMYVVPSSLAFRLPPEEKKPFPSSDLWSSNRITSRQPPLCTRRYPTLYGRAYQPDFHSTFASKAEQERKPTKRGDIEK